jgi:hypothetical protein
MTEPTLAELEAERDRLYAQLAAVGDSRRGSVSENWACAPVDLRDAVTGLDDGNITRLVTAIGPHSQQVS